jgi:polysaccharide chain length determinant protein (PEP-CTERM system associated)
MQTEQIERRELTPADYIAMLRRHWVLILILTVIGPPIGYGVSRVIPPRYVSQTMVLVQPPSVPNTIVPQMDTTSMNQKLASLQQQILSRSRLEPMIRQFGLYPKDVNRESMDELVARLQEAIDVSAVAPLAQTNTKDLPGFSVSVTMSDPHTAQDVCTEVTSMFIEASNGNTEEQSRELTQFLTNQLAEAKAGLDEQDAKLAAFKTQHSGSLPDDQQANLNLLTVLTAQLDAANQALVRAQQDKAFEESLLEQQVAASQATQNGQSPDTLQQQLAALQSQLATLQAKYLDDYPDVIKAKADIASLKKRIAASTGTASSEATVDPKLTVEPPEITQLRSQIHTSEVQITEKTREQEQVKQQIGTYQARVQQTPAVEAQYSELTRGHQTALDAYNALLKEHNEAEMSGELNRQQQGENFHVLDAANLPSAPDFPNRNIFTAAGLAGGLGLGIGLTLFFELKDTSLKSERDVEFTLRLPVLALIPAVEPVTTKKSSTPTMLQAASSEAGLSLRV